MDSTTTVIGNKTVQLAAPYRLPTAEPLIGRDAELRLLTAAWLAVGDQAPMSPLLVGEPGTGKGKIVFELARRTGRPLFVLTGHDDFTPEDVVGCHVRFSDDTEKRFDYVLGPLATALVCGGTLFIDEIAKLRPRALAPLTALLDERRYVDSLVLGERIHAAPGFRVVAATNTSDLDALSMPEFLRSRLRPVIHVGPPSRDTIDGILTSRFDRRFGRERADALLDAFWTGWVSRSSQTGPTPRDAILVFSLAGRLADHASLDTTGSHLPLECAAGGALQARHLEEALGHFFATGATR
jgi:MoxR-like ATPase